MHWHNLTLLLSRVDVGTRFHRTCTYVEFQFDCCPIGVKPEEEETQRTSGEAVTSRMPLRFSADEWNVVEGVCLLYEFLGAGTGITCIRPGPQPESLSH